jgi:hypothetical protein
MIDYNDGSENGGTLDENRRQGGVNVMTIGVKSGHLARNLLS